MPSLSAHVRASRAIYLEFAPTIQIRQLRNPDKSAIKRPTVQYVDTVYFVVEAFLALLTKLTILLNSYWKACSL
jgi:hypothetical protein